MPNIYKIKIGNKLSKKNFTLAGAREIKKSLKAKGKEAEIFKFKENVKVFDISDTGEIHFYSESE